MVEPRDGCTPTTRAFSHTPADSSMIQNSPAPECRENCLATLALLRFPLTAAVRRVARHRPRFRKALKTTWESQRHFLKLSRTPFFKGEVTRNDWRNRQATSVGFTSRSREGGRSPCRKVQGEEGASSHEPGVGKVVQAGSSLGGGGAERLGKGERRAEEGRTGTREN